MDVVFMFKGHQAVVSIADRIPVTGVVGGEIFSCRQGMDRKPVGLLSQQGDIIIDSVLIGFDMGSMLEICHIIIIFESRTDR